MTKETDWAFPASKKSDSKKPASKTANISATQINFSDSTFREVNKNIQKLCMDIQSDFKGTLLCDKAHDLQYLSENMNKRVNEMNKGLSIKAWALLIFPLWALMIIDIFVALKLNDLYLDFTEPANIWATFIVIGIISQLVLYKKLKLIKQLPICDTQLGYLIKETGSLEDMHIHLRSSQLEYDSNGHYHDTKSGLTAKQLQLLYTYTNLLFIQISLIARYYLNNVTSQPLGRHYVELTSYIQDCIQQTTKAQSDLSILMLHHPDIPQTKN